MGEGYEYENESEGMRDAIERARDEQPKTAEELDALLEKMREGWATSEGEEGPSEEAAVERVRESGGGKDVFGVLEAEPAVRKLAPDEPVEADVSKMENAVRKLAPASPIEPDVSKMEPLAKTAEPLDVVSDATEVTADLPPPPTEPWAKMKHDLRENETRKPPPDPMEAKMASVGWTPKPNTVAGGKPDWAKLQSMLAEQPPTPPPAVQAPAAAPVGPDWEKLQADVQKADRDAEQQRTIAAMLHAVAPGFVAPARIGMGDVDAAQHAYEMAQAKQKADVEQGRLKREGEAKLLTTARDQEENNPASAASKKAREGPRPVFEMMGEVPAGFDTWSAREVKEFAKTLAPVATSKTKLDATEAERERAVGAKELAANEKAVATADATAADEESLVQRRSVLAADPRAKKLGLTPEAIGSMGRKDLDKVQHQFESMPREKPKAAPAKAITKLEDITDPADRGKVKAIGEGHADLSIAGLKDRGRIAGLVVQAYPNYDQTKFRAYGDVVKKTANDQQLQNAITARKHFELAMKNIPENFDVQAVNRIKNYLTTGSGSDVMTPFETDIAIGAGELSKGLGENAEGGKELIRHLLSPNQSKAQLQSRLKELIFLQDEAVGTKRERFEAYAPEGTKAPKILDAPKEPLKTVPTRTGGVGYRGRKDPLRVFTTPEEAEAH